MVTGTMGGVEGAWEEHVGYRPKLCCLLYINCVSLKVTFSI